MLHERIATLQTRLDNEKQKVPPADTGRGVLIGWGSPMGCGAVIDGGKLVEFKDKYDVALVCGLVDPTVDKMTDKRITASPVFTIRPEVIPIVMPLGNEMAEGQRKLTAPLREALKGQPPPPPGMTTQFVVNKWHELVLVPKGAEVPEIHRLLDVPHLGGRILSQEGWHSGGVSPQ